MKSLNNLKIGDLLFLKENSISISTSNDSIKCENVIGIFAGERIGRRQTIIFLCGQKTFWSGDLEKTWGDYWEAI